MNVDHYTPIHFAKRSLHISQIFSTHFEPMLLSLLVLTGFIGSIYLFGQNIQGNHSGQFSTAQTDPENASISNILFASEEDNASGDFDDFVKMPDKTEAGKVFYFDFLQDEKASRYVMEMGDGVRLIVTQKNLQYTYKEPGKYIVELKEIKRGLLNLIGTKKIKVK
ncbi:MAG: hypothetical protein IPO92_13375 [Saprospiraceae bacterium]|nr:hypothetical protein [Saprospiraceae bacterium]